MFFTKKLKSEKSQWIEGDSTPFLFVRYCLSLNYIHTLEAKQIRI